MKKTLIFLFSLVAGIAQAQDIFKGKIYTTTHLMEVREEIELTDAQVAKIKKIHSENSGQFSTVKWDLDDATAKLKKMLDEPKINQSIVSKQFEEVLRLENKLKRTQLNTLVSIKNELSPNQITKLEEKKIIVFDKATSIYGSQVSSSTATASSVNSTACLV